MTRSVLRLPSFNMDIKSKVRYTTIINKYPTYRDNKIKSPLEWLKGRIRDDNAEGYWRIHDKLYNLNEFVDKHPGGSTWLKFTKGTDITEAFESYHVLPKASQVLNKYYAKDADKPRNYRLTYKDDGFYRTLKRKVAERYPLLDKSKIWKPKMVMDVFLIIYFVSSILSIRAEKTSAQIFYVVIAGLCASWGNATEHNYTHQRDNWRMYAGNVYAYGWRAWRIFHGLSHHMYPNSDTDFETYTYEPYLDYMPNANKSTLKIIFSYLYSPLLYAFAYSSIMTHRIMGWFYEKNLLFGYDELLLFLLPVCMSVFGGLAFSIKNILYVYFMWTAIQMIGSFIYIFVSVNAGHHGPEFVHEGDEVRDLDFGIFQMAATVDRFEANYDSYPLTMILFGDHTLHHLFPSIDHALLPQLRDILFETCKEFDIDFRHRTSWDCVVQHYKQIARKTPIVLDDPSEIVKSD